MAGTSAASNSGSHSAVVRLRTTAARMANQSRTLLMRSATVRKRGSCERSSRPTARKNAETWASVLAVSEIQPSVADRGIEALAAEMFVQHEG